MEVLMMANCQLVGHLTDQLRQFKHLVALDLSYNSISGSIPSCLGELSSLMYLIISNNKLEGNLSSVHFANLTRLQTFDASGNSLMLKVGPDWIPPFQLETLYLRSCHLGSEFPSWLLSQKCLRYLDISNTAIDTVTSRFWKFLPQLVYLNLSHNKINGEIPNLTGCPDMVDMSSNNFSGPLTLIHTNFRVLDLSNNSLSGSISHFLCYGLFVLNLQGNFLSGELPDFWMYWTNLVYLHLGNYKFVGNLPNSTGALNFLQSLHLRNNYFSGKIPASLKNYTNLRVLDVGENEFAGNFPTWIGEFPKLIILNLRSNKLNGHLSLKLRHLTSLQVLDLARNNLSGNIPKCINNISAMIGINYSAGNDIHYLPDSWGEFVEDVSLVMKGKFDNYNSILDLVRIVDLSDNMFSGEIPMEVSELGALQTLNLSHNLFTGRIPESIGAMRSLESIDVSVNQLSGKIPASMPSLSFLHHLNLSNNNLTGKIPSSTQLQSFDASCFGGNDLCGSPLPNNCTENVSVSEDIDKDEDEDGVDYLFYASMSLGFLVGFWTVMGSLLANRRWRFKYCHFLDLLGDKFANIVRRRF